MTHLFITITTLILILCSSTILGANQKEKRIIFGNEVLRNTNYKDIQNKNVAILTNPTGVFSDSLVHIVDDMASKEDLHVYLKCIFGPEHGFRGEKQAETGDELFYIDKDTKLPVFSGYNMNQTQISTSLKDLNIEVLLVDMQDVGIRLYTFIWTMFDMLKSIAAMDEKIEVIILDRPNPLGGLAIDGPLLDTACCSSGYGKFPIPHIHGMTIGELALLFNTAIGLQPEYLSVVRVENWERDMVWVDSTSPQCSTFNSATEESSSSSSSSPIFPPWVPPSPNIPTPGTNLAYGATCFIEATTAAEGRGTTTPFQLFGAPFLDSLSFAARLNADFRKVAGSGSGLGSEAGAPGTRFQLGQEEEELYLHAFRATYFNPTFSKYNGTSVPGVQWVQSRTRSRQGRGEEGGIQDPFAPFAAGVRILCAIRDEAEPKSDFQWDGSWFGHPGPQLIDDYAGNTSFRLMIDRGVPADEVIAAFQQDTRVFRETRRPYLLYGVKE